MLERIITFFKEAKIELKKVIWPTRQDTINYTLTVIVVSVVVALFLGGLDYIFQFVLKRFVL